MKRLCRLLLVLAALPLLAAERSDKQGGICFRADDNHTPAKWNELRAVFDKHGYKLGASLNLLSGVSRPGFVEFVRDLQAGGHEVMDHSPNHRVFQLWLASEEAANAYAGKPGVSHTAGRNVYFRYRIQPVRSAHTGEAVVAGKTFRPADPDAFKNWQGVPFLLFQDDPETAWLLARNKEGEFELRDFWGGDTVDLGPERTRAYRRLCKEDIRVDHEALRLQAQLVRDLCDQHGIERLTTWIQPGGNEPTVWADDLAAVLGKEFGYTAGAVYPDSAIKCFNEPDPRGDRRFAMQWGNFDEEKRDLEWNKARIADGVARRQVLVGHSHLGGAADLGGWQGTLERTDAILAWCRETGIPVRTMREWADILYTQPTDPNVNIFPDLGTDRDGNGRPDGLSLGYGVSLGKDDAGFWLEATRTGAVCTVHDLGGLEKGANEFAVELAAGAGATLEVAVTFREAPKATQRLALVPAGPNRYAATIEVPPEAARATIVLEAANVSAPLRLRQPTFRQPEPAGE